MIEVIKPGLFTTVQDTGRFGYGKYGIPISGAMDSESALLANMLLDNALDMPVLEMTIQGPLLKFTQPAQIVLTGADLNPVINQIPVKMNQPADIQEGDLLEFGTARFGIRIYLGLTGGFDIPAHFGSCSYYPGVYGKNRLEAGDHIPFKVTTHRSPHTNALVRTDLKKYYESTIEVMPGPEFHQLSDKQANAILHHTHVISRLNNRMAYQLETDIINEIPPIHSAPVLPGTVQLTPSGKMIILMRDCQTTGGYPRILQLTEHSINKLSQKRQADLIQFRLSEY